MKKIGKKLSYFTKVLLVLGLIISNLSSLSLVFAYEGEGDTDSLDVVATNLSMLDASIDDENKITISYAGSINDTDELEIRVSEEYIYSNCEVTDSVLECGITMNNSYSVDDANKELLLNTGMVVDYTPSVLSQAKFDGVYKLTVALVNVTEDNALIEEQVLDDKEVSFDSGIEFKLYDKNDTLISASNEKYAIDSSNNLVTVIGKMLPGGISPNDEFIYEDNIYSAIEILDFGFKNTIDFSNRLYGEYKVPVSIVYTKNNEETEYIEHFNISYGTYEDNAALLNTYVDSSKFAFNSTSKDGNVYVYLGDDLITINDLYSVLEAAYSSSEDITYIISNDDYSEENGGILASYDSESGESISEYLSNISVDASTKISITDGLLTITYQVLLVGDINDDNILDENDIIDLIDYIVGNKELSIDKANIYDEDDEVTVLDVMKLDQIVKTGAWNVQLSEDEIQLDAKLEFTNSEIEITSGDEFDINYVLVSSEDDVNGVAGNIEYDDTKLELVSITAIDGFIGNNNDGKFVYVGTNVSSSSSVMQDNNTDTSGNIVLLTLKFKALAGGTSAVKLNNYEYFNQDTYYNVVEIDDETGQSVPKAMVISLDVTVSESDDNSLSSLKVGDTEIELVDGVYDYKLTVGNDVTKINISALVANVAASVSSIVAPEELAVGDNTITVTVVSESGEECTYTIVVTREDAPTATSNQVNYQNNVTNNNVTNTPQDTPKSNDEKDVTPEEPIKEKSNLSKIIIIVLIVLVIGGLIYLIFKDDDDESKTANKEINKFIKDDFDNPHEKATNVNNKKNQNKNNKKGR